jgi:hypothetical protein
MIDWTKQIEDMTKTWVDAQKKMWDNWLGSMQQVDKTQTAELWAKTVSTWEEAVKNTLNAQTEWTRVWVDSLKSFEGMPKEVNEWAQQALEMNKHWSETQQQLWDSWFALVKKIDSAKLSSDWNEEGQKLYKTWQEATQQMINTQMEWMRRWTTVSNGTKTSDKSSKAG